MAMPSRLFCLALVTLFLTSAPVRVQAADAMSSVDVRQVKVGGEIGRRIDRTIHNNVLVIDVEKDFLASVRAHSANDGFVGVGMFLDSVVRFAAYANDPKVTALKDHLIAAIIANQQPDGYVGLCAPGVRMTALWDIHEMGYVILGLTNDYRYFGDKRSLDAAQKLADYIIGNWQKLPADWDRTTAIATHVSVTGVERAILTLYGQTKQSRYLDFCTNVRKLPEWNLGVVIGRRDGIEGHIFAYLARCLAQVELYRSLPDARLLQPTRRAVKFMTGQDGAAITGGAGQWEIWTNDQDGREALGETCATAYQIRLYHSLLQMEGDSRYGDLMERTIYNALFAAQSPDGRRIRYYTALEGPRAYFEQDNFCCPNNYRRIVSELPSMLYYRTGTGVAVNLYSPSEATFPLGSDVSLKIRQETNYPTSGHVVIRIDPSKPTTFPLDLRIPRWCEKAAVAVNGHALETPVKPGTFLAIQREWKAGDQVTLDLPMPWRFVEGRKRQAGRVAVMRGPLVYCLNPAQNEKLVKRDAADISGIMLDPKSLQESPGSGAARPNDTACSVAAGAADYNMWRTSDFKLRLTEFADPEGKCTYFRLLAPNTVVPDELFSGECK